MIQGGTRLVDWCGEALRDVEPWCEMPAPALELCARYQRVRPGATMLRREWLERVGGFDSGLRCAEDVDLLLRLALAGCEMGWLRQPAVCYRQHGGNINRDAVQEAQCMELVLERFYARSDVPERIRRLETTVRFHSLVWSASRMYCYGQTDHIDEWLRRSLGVAPYSVEQAVMEWSEQFAAEHALQGDTANEWGGWFPYFHAAVPAGSAQCAFPEDVLDWWVDVWRHYVDNDSKQAVEGLVAYHGQAVCELTALVEVSVVRMPVERMAEVIAQCWADMRAMDLVPASRAYEVTGLYLTALGQAVLARKWRVAWQALWRALRSSIRPGVVRVWFEFIRTAWVHLQGRYRNSDLARPAHVTRFAVVSNWRSGSNFLVSLLESHPAIRQNWEAVGEGKLWRQDIRAEILTFGPAPYLERCFARKESELAIGIKVIYYQVTDENARWWRLERLPQTLDLLSSNRDIKIIHLKRRNRLRIVVSHRMAHRTKQWILCDESERIDDVQIELSADECADAFDRIGRLEREFDDAFRHNKILEVTYEDLVANTVRECDRILDLLGVPRLPLRAWTLKQNKRSLREIVRNYEELKRQFAGTQWEVFFEE
jgi:hypothetical protein